MKDNEGWTTFYTVVGMVTFWYLVLRAILAMFE